MAPTEPGRRARRDKPPRHPATHTPTPPKESPQTPPLQVLGICDKIRLGGDSDAALRDRRHSRPRGCPWIGHDWRLAGRQHRPLGPQLQLGRQVIPPVPSLFTLFSHAILSNQGLPQRRCRSRRVPRRLFRPGCRAQRPAARHGRLLGKTCLQPHAAMRGGRLRSGPARLARCKRGQGDGAGGSAHV